VEDVRREILASGIPEVAANILKRPVDGLDTLISAIAEMDAVVATRYHGIVFALQLNKPVVGISYDPKTSDLMRDMGLGDYVLDIDGLKFEALVNSFELLQNNMGQVEQTILEATAAYAARLAEQYDRVLSLVVAELPPNGGNGLGLDVG
jgi:polysaccharide pyruvyl transferase WcaK-like protein